jgi:hypothetical protein
VREDRKGEKRTRERAERGRREDGIRFRERERETRSRGEIEKESAFSNRFCCEPQDLW